MNYELLGKHIRKQRKEKKYTLEQLAEKLDVSIGYISQVERGITKISLDFLGAMSLVLDCDIANFISESAVNSNEYLDSELIDEFKKLDSKKKKFILKVIKDANECL